MNIRRIIRTLISAVVSVLLLTASVTALAETIYTEGTLYYTVGDNSITIVGCFGRDSEVTIPSQIAGTPVNTIASGAFADNEYVKTVYVPSTVTTIEEGAMGSANAVFVGSTDSVSPTSAPTPTATVSPTATPAPTASSASSSTVSSSAQSTTTAGTTSSTANSTSAAAVSNPESDFFETDVYIDENGNISGVEYDSTFFQSVQSFATEEQYSTARLILIIVLALVAIILILISYVKPKKRKTGRH